MIRYTYSVPLIGFDPADPLIPGCLMIQRRLTRIFFAISSMITAHLRTKIALVFCSKDRIAVDYALERDVYDSGVGGRRHDGWHGMDSVHGEVFVDVWTKLFTEKDDFSCLLV